MENHDRNEEALIKRCNRGWNSVLKRFSNIVGLAPVGLKSFRRVVDTQVDPTTGVTTDRTYERGDLVPSRHDGLAARDDDDEPTKLDKAAKQATRDRNIAAAEAYQLEVETSALIDAAQGMLALNRSLKEAWLFGKLDTLGRSDAEKTTDEHARVVAGLLPKIVNSGETKSNGNT